MNCKAECPDCKAAPAELHELWRTEGKKKRKEQGGGKSERKRNGEKAEGNDPRARDFSTRWTIFKLSASAYDARVKSRRVDFRCARELSEKTPEMRGECAPAGTPRVK